LPPHSTEFKALELINNLAHAYGNDIATSPFETVALGDASLSLIPMIDNVNVQIILRDSFGQTITGTVDIPIHYILEIWTCPTATCEIQQSLSPLTFLTFDSESGIANTLTLKQTVPCSKNSSTVTIRISLYGTKSSLLMETFTVLCLACGATQVRVNEITTNAASIWFCRPCLTGQYIINPSQDTCHDCPAGKPFKF
jgi:hypothetical protein